MMLSTIRTNTAHSGQMIKKIQLCLRLQKRCSFQLSVNFVGLHERVMLRIVKKSWSVLNKYEFDFEQNSLKICLELELEFHKEFNLSSNSFVNQILSDCLSFFPVFFLSNSRLRVLEHKGSRI